MKLVTAAALFLTLPTVGMAVDRDFRPLEKSCLAAVLFLEDHELLRDEMQLYLAGLLVGAHEMAEIGYFDFAPAFWDACASDPSQSIEDVLPGVLKSISKN